jgi:hypothetical protein
VSKTSIAFKRADQVLIYEKVKEPVRSSAVRNLQAKGGQLNQILKIQS